LNSAEAIFGAGFAGTTETEIKCWEISKALSDTLNSKMTEGFCFTFGKEFGEKLFGHVVEMLQSDWTKRPSPTQVYGDISQFL